MTNTLVFLHGFLGAPDEFQQLTSQLQDFQCISIHLDHAPSFSLKAQAEYVHEELLKLGINKAHFWGYSMGGRVLLELYKKYPLMCVSLTLESVSPGLTEPFERDQRLKIDTKWAEEIQIRPQEFIKSWYTQELFSGFKAQDDFHRYAQEKLKRLNSKHAKMIVEASPGVNPHHFEVIENIDVPTLALVGQFDKKYCQIWGKLIDKNPNIAIQIISNSGHVIHLENSAGALREFLNFQRELKRE